MRRLRKLKALDAGTLASLSNQAHLVEKSTNKKAEAARLYKIARQAPWFKAAILELTRLSGPGSRCMYCSGSEAGDLEHYRPKDVYPEFTFAWENYLWSCTPCNRLKGSKFPPFTEPGGQFINPLRENVWDFFFIDKFGILTPIYDDAIDDLNIRANTTQIELELNREAVQQSRFIRIKDLKRQARLSLKQIKNGEITVAKAKSLVSTWKSQPFQPDVADFFLNGPGKKQAPFAKLFALIGATPK